jgi:anti-anti-sigma regulatory factor
MSGELDASSRAEAFAACCNCTGFSVVVDLAELTYMDADGYAAIVDAIRMLRSEGRSATIRGIRGQPQRLVVLMGVPNDVDFVQPARVRGSRSMSSGY